jgi:hypothetical protein
MRLGFLAMGPPRVNVLTLLEVSTFRGKVRQAEMGRGSARASPSKRPSSGNVDLCGRRQDRLQLMRIPLGGHAPHKFGSLEA